MYFYNVKILDIEKTNSSLPDSSLFIFVSAHGFFADQHAEIFK